MKNLEFNLAKSFMYDLIIGNDEELKHDYQAYNIYIKSMQKHELEYNSKLYEIIASKYIDFMLNLNIWELC